MLYTSVVRSAGLAIRPVFMVERTGNHAWTEVWIPEAKQWRAYDGGPVRRANEAGMGKRLGALLDHVELADLQRKQFYPKVDKSTFQTYVLSPGIDRLPLTEIDWRRPLWEHFYPRVRSEHDPLAAAQTIIRSLRERVGISPDYPYRVGVETIWTQGMTDATGFERIYVAALRSVGIAAQLGAKAQAEIWTGTAWQPAPRPFTLSYGPQP